MPRVLIADKMSPSATEVFKNRGVEVDVITGLDNYCNTLDIYSTVDTKYISSRFISN